MEITNGLKGRFCKLYGIPINLYEEPYFQSRLELLDKQYGAVEKYKELLYSQHYFDYSLILREMLEQMQKNDEFRKRITSRVKFLTVDEYQDTNSIQEKLIQFVHRG